ncbi:MAG: DUF87 domain-containing protein [Nitrososphaeria archaeon]
MPYLNLGSSDKGIFTIDANIVVTGRTCVLGTSGSGKSYVVGVICEELCKMRIPFTLLDVEGEYSGLKERYEAIWIGEDDNCDLKWEKLNIKELAKNAPDIAPLILDVSETKDPELKVDRFLKQIYSEVSSRRVPYLIIIEEADKYAPQVGKRLQIVEEIARRGRKRGLGLMLCTQRPSLVDKNTLSQCSNQLIGKLVIKNDLESVAQFFPGKGLPKHLTSLSPGSFYALGGLSPAPLLVKIRQRETTHGGITPLIVNRIVNLSIDLNRFRVLEPKEYVLGLPRRIDYKDISTKIKRGKRYLLFGEEEIIEKIQLIYRPLIELRIRIHSGFLRKSFLDKFLTIDGQTGVIVEVKNGVVFKETLEPFIGLNPHGIKLLKILDTNKEIAINDINTAPDFSKGLVRRSLNALEKRSFVKVLKYGKIKKVRRIVVLPKIQLEGEELKLERIDLSEAKKGKVRVNARSIKDAIETLLPGSELIGSRCFYYPFYVIKLRLGKKYRFITVDGLSGKIVDF